MHQMQTEQMGLILRLMLWRLLEMKWMILATRITLLVNNVRMRMRR